MRGQSRSWARLLPLLISVLEDRMYLVLEVPTTCPSNHRLEQSRAVAEPDGVRFDGRGSTLADR